MLLPSIFGESLIDDFFDDFAKPIMPAARFTAPANAVMKTDIKETDKEYLLEVELPGYNKEDINAQLKDGYLTVSAKTNSENEEKDKDGNYIRRERRYGSCTRSFYVGEHLSEEDISAKFENGILNINVPKKEALPEKEETKYIQIAG